MYYLMTSLGQKVASGSHPTTDWPTGQLTHRAVYPRSSLPTGQHNHSIRWQLSLDHLHSLAGARTRPCWTMEKIWTITDNQSGVVDSLAASLDNDRSIWQAGGRTLRLNSSTASASRRLLYMDRIYIFEMIPYGAVQLLRNAFFGRFWPPPPPCHKVSHRPKPPPPPPVT